jgi:hypothetical protein
VAPADCERRRSMELSCCSWSAGGLGTVTKTVESFGGFAKQYELGHAGAW